ncbi:MAG: hypothetical protein N2445_08320 [Acidobacteria bacterium]|nr:hypothetical protein [Acidobacteriota bacterium]
MINERSVTINLGGREITFSTQKVARQADGAFWVRYGDSVVLVTACVDKNEKEDVDFLPFTVDYREYTFAGGKIPGGFFKREGKPTDSEVLVARLIDRPLRPIFPEGWTKETQVIAMVLSTDYENSPDIMAINGASFALYCSPIPFPKPIGAVRIGYKEGEYFVNPSQKLFDELELNIVVAGTKDAICMVESGSKEVLEPVIIKALEIAHENIKKIVEKQEELFKEMGIVKEEFSPKCFDENFYKEVEDKCSSKFRQAMEVKGKKAMYGAIDNVVNDTVESYPEEEEEKRKEVQRICEDILIKIFRKMVIPFNLIS